MKRVATYLILSAALLVLPRTEAAAQIDALIDAVVDAVEPTPVYDSGLREATENLASKIERLNRVLFGGAEETSAAYRYATMYSDLYDLTTSFSSFVDRSYSNAQRMERVYSRLGSGGQPYDYALAAQATWYTYENTVREGSRIVARFKKLFSDPNVTNSEVRRAAREAVGEMEEQQRLESRRISSELATTEVAAGLVECSAILAPSVKEYVSEGKKAYGTTLAEGGTESSTGTLGTAVMVVIGLLLVVYAAFTGINIMRGSPQSEKLIARLIAMIVIALVAILSIQAYL